MSVGADHSENRTGPRGRGATINPADRFTALRYELDEFSSSEEARPLPTEFFRDDSQSIELKLKLTRSCLEVLAEFRNPAAIVTKNFLVTRDIDLLQELAKYDAIIATISITTLDADLAAKLEPRASTPRARLAAVREL